MEDYEFVFDFENKCYMNRHGLIWYYLPFDNVYVCMAISYFIGNNF